MTLEEIVDGILDADLKGRAGAYADIIVALAASIPGRIPDRLENYAADEAWEWLRGELRILARKIRSSAELHI